MVRCNKEAKYTEKKMFDGAGMARMRLILESNAEMYDKGRVFNHLYLDPGCEVGWHIHHGDGETYYILKGQGEYNDNGTEPPTLQAKVSRVFLRHYTNPPSLSSEKESLRAKHNQSGHHSGLSH